MRLTIAMIFALIVAGCQPTPVVTPAPASCGAEGYQSLVGAKLAAVTMPADLNARIIKPGQAVTLDFRPDRINFELDARGVIRRVYCG